ncbi:MAG: hypothetical protein CALGDGBN_00820 [Pseudomonadales bacterium]|nr:hypothetical protein [Pseudomonadales bacterium]
MPTSSTRISELRGFTLLELLVALALLGLLSGMAVLAVGGIEERRAREEAAALRDRIAFASEEAMLQGEEYLLAVGSGSYRFLRFDAGERQWREASHPLLGERRLPHGLRIEIETEALAGSAEALTDATAATTDGESVEVLLLSSGEITPFSALFHAGESGPAAATLRGEGGGGLELE